MKRWVLCVVKSVKIWICTPVNGAPMWVVDFPMFEELDDGGLTAIHHPFTAPSCSPEELKANPSTALSRAYDMVPEWY